MKGQEQAAKKILYEIAWLDKDRSLRRGGLKATIATVGKWIEEVMKVDSETLYMAVPANEEAVTWAEYLKETEAARKEEEVA